MKDERVVGEHGFDRAAKRAQSITFLDGSKVLRYQSIVS
jgi:hypothetical protein